MMHRHCPIQHLKPILEPQSLDTLKKMRFAAIFNTFLVTSLVRVVGCKHLISHTRVKTAAANQGLKCSIGS